MKAAILFLIIVYPSTPERNTQRQEKEKEI